MCGHRLRMLKGTTIGKVGLVARYVRLPMGHQTVGSDTNRGGYLSRVVRTAPSSATKPSRLGGAGIRADKVVAAWRLEEGLAAGTRRPPLAGGAPP
jgi:hypothetical protein